MGDSHMGFLISLLLGLLGIGSLVCFIMVLIKMFQSGDQTLGIICLVLILCLGIGYFAVFVLGWINSSKWNAKNLMMIWTGIIAAFIILDIIFIATGGPMIPFKQ
jgi:hypothetical protein